MKKQLFLVLIAYSSTSLAEGGCPPGHYPQQGQGWRACVPDQTEYDVPRRSSPHWQDRWAAMATDAKAAALGTAAGARSRELAEAQAIHDCRRQGGSTCKLQISHGNGCFAMAVGEKMMNFMPGRDLELAERRALDECGRTDKRCKIYHSFCSLAELVP